MRPTCKSCVHAHIINTTQHIQCRVNPPFPLVVPGQTGEPIIECFFPVLREDLYCGQHKQGTPWS